MATNTGSHLKNETGLYKKYLLIDSLTVARIIRITRTIGKHGPGMLIQ